MIFLVWVPAQMYATFTFHSRVSPSLDERSWIFVLVVCFQLSRGRVRGTAPVRVRTPTTRPSTAPPSRPCSRPRRPVPSALHLPPSWCPSESSSSRALRVNRCVRYPLIQAAPEVLVIKMGLNKMVIGEISLWLIIFIWPWEKPLTKWTQPY